MKLRHIQKKLLHIETAIIYISSMAITEKVCILWRSSYLQTLFDIFPQKHSKCLGAFYNRHSFFFIDTSKVILKIAN